MGRKPLDRWALLATAFLLLASPWSGFRGEAGTAPQDSAPDAILTVAAPPDGARQPSAAVDAKGGVHVAFVAGGMVLVASCPPGAESFGEPRTVDVTPDLSWGMRRGPRLAACGEVLVASWIEARFDARRKRMAGSQDLVASRSADGGATWSRPARVNRAEGVCGEGLHAMAAGPGTTLYAAWLQPLRPGKRGTGIHLARSDDAGATWTHETSVYDPPSGTVCECCHPTVAVAPDGTVAVVFRNSLDRARDMYAVSSKDRGKDFGGARKLGRGTWPLPG